MNPAATYATRTPLGASFYRDPHGQPVMLWPNPDRGEGGVWAQLLCAWVEENCAPGTRFNTVGPDVDFDHPDADTIVAVDIFSPDGTGLAGDYNAGDYRVPAGVSVPRVFHLVRYDDPSGVSGCGIVAQGIQARDGAVALRWCVPGLPSTWNLFDSISDVERLNGHNGRTVVKWVDGRG